MAGYFNKLIATLVQSTGANTGLLSTASDRASFQTNVKADLARLISQYNNVVYPAFISLRSGPAYDDVIEYGVEGRSITTYGGATSAGAPCYWNTSLNAPASIKDTIDYLITEMDRLENLLSAFEVDGTYDDSSILQAIYCLQLDRSQIALDTFGEDYSTDCDGSADLNYPLARHIYEIGQLLNGFPSMGFSFTGSYPTLSLNVNLSEVNIDTTLPLSVITELGADLGAIRTFVGMDALEDSTPDYSVHVVNPLNWIADGMSLEEAIALLDEVAETITATNLGAGARVFASKVASQLGFRTLTGTSGLITATQNPNTINLDLVAGLDDLTDVTLVAPSNGQLLIYDSAASQWVNSTDGNTVGNNWVEPAQCIAPAAAPINLRDPGPPVSPIVVNFFDYAGATEAEELSFRFLEFKVGGQPCPDAQRVMWTLGVPNTGMAASSLKVSKCRVVAHFVLPDSFPWGGGAGGAALFDLQIGQSTTAVEGIITNRTQIIHAGNIWGTVVSKTLTAAPGALPLTSYVLDFGTTSLNPAAKDGLVNFRLRLNPLTAPTGDFVNNAAAIWFVGATVVWLR